MNFTNLSLDQMALETMELTDSLRSKNFGDFEEYKKFIEEFNANLFTQDTQNELYSDTLPSSGGLVYRVDRGVSTFCVRGIITENIQYVFEMLNIGDDKYYQKLKIDNDQQMNDVSFFRTDSQELSQIVYRQMINRRFPYYEDILCNLSDPGFSWWMEYDYQTLRIYYKSHRINRVQEMIRLGPIGDNKTAHAHFSQSLKILNSIFMIDEFFCSENGFGIRVKESNSKSFELFRNLFLHGESFVEQKRFAFLNEYRSFRSYLKQLAILRKFWISIEDQLNPKIDQNNH